MTDQVFKVGDKVRLTGRKWEGTGEHPLKQGNIVTISEVHPSKLQFKEYREYRELDGHSDFAWNIIPGWEVEKVEEMGIKVGDLVKLTRKGEPERTVTGYVAYIDAQCLDTNGDTFGYFYFADWDVELIKRPYSLPTEPGLYTIARNNEEVPIKRVFRLNQHSYTWTENSSSHTGSGGTVEQYLLAHEWSLKRLVIEG